MLLLCNSLVFKSNYLFILLSTFLQFPKFERFTFFFKLIIAVKVMVKENIRKFCSAVGIKKWLSRPQVDEPIFCERVGSKPNNSSVEGPNGPNFADARYISWLVLIKLLFCSLFH